MSQEGYIKDILKIGETVKIKGPFGNAYLRNKHKDLWKKSLAMEKNSTLRLPLINMRGKESQTLMECACFNG